MDPFSLKNECNKYSKYKLKPRFTTNYNNFESKNIEGF